MQAAVSKPPFERPLAPTLPWFAMPESTRVVAQAMKSSNTCCLLPSMPARCHASPCSMPPRRLARTTDPPASRNATRAGLNIGVTGMLKPPYPYSSTGAGPSDPPAENTHIGTETPSVEAARRRRTLTDAGSIGGG